jgi:hypothetical protein
MTSRRLSKMESILAKRDTTKNLSPLGFSEASGHVDAGAIGQRHNGADTEEVVHVAAAQVVDSPKQLLESLNFVAV